ncbi:MAG: tetratricopeptide repeat protein [bacterium]|nr:tetratricopeptide repeat protein [bacterium]
MFSEKYNEFLKIFLSVTVITFVLFGPSLRGDFTLDDHSVIEHGVQLKSFKNILELWISPWHPGGEWAGNYRPLTTTSFALNTFFSEGPLGFRIVNILLYALNIVFIFYLVRRLSTEKVAYLTAIIFLFLPIHSEVVMSIVGRVYLLGTLFSLLSIHYLLENKYWASSVYFLLALLAGDIFISVILIIGSLLLLEHKNIIKTFKLGITFMAGLPIYFLFRYLALGKYAFGGYGFVDPIIGPLAFVSVKERVFTAFSHLYLYFRKTVYPIDLSPDYSFNQVPIVSNLFSSWRASIGLAFLAILVYIFYKSKRKDIRFAVILFLIPYLVMSNIFFITTGTMAERWWYFPSIGLAMLVAIGIEILNSKFNLPAGGQSLKFKNYIYGAGIMVLVFYSFIIFRQNRVWLNDKNLFIYASEKSPNSAWARTNVAEGFFLSGDTERAKKEIEAALKIADQYPSALYVLGQIYWKEGRFGEAEDVFNRAIKFDIYDRNKRSLYRSLALISLDVGNNKQALAYMTEAIKWPATGDLEKTLKIDEILLQKIEEYSNRDINSYTQKEIEGLLNLIKILRGF